MSLYVSWVNHDEGRRYTGEIMDWDSDLRLVAIAVPDTRHHPYYRVAIVSECEVEQQTVLERMKEKTR